MTAKPGSLNWREIDLVLAELDLPGTIVQEASQPAFDRIVLDLFRPRESRGVQRLSLMVCLSGRYPRLHALTTRLANPPKAPRFAMFLRAHMKGARIASAAQAGHERVVRLEVSRAGERLLLWIRLWGAASNLIVTDEAGVILDAFYRRPKRGEISGGRFEAPVAREGPEGTPDYQVRELAGAGSFNGRLERYFAELESETGRSELATRVESELSMREAKLAATLQKLEARRAEYGNLGRWKELGDLITSNLHRAGKGERWLRVEDWYREGAPVDIELAPDLTPAQNAERYYGRYRKARDGRERLEKDIGEIAAALREVEQARERLAGNPDLATIREARQEAAAPPGRGPRTTKREVPGLLFQAPPWRFLVGRSARENDELLRRHVRGNDWWFHARDWAGAYVFVKSDAGKPPPLEVMLDAANLAIHFSRGKNAGGGDVYYTQVKYLRRAKDGPRGLVLPTQEKNISVKLDPARIERLKAAGGSSHNADLPKK